MGEHVINSLRGKVLMNPKKQKWTLKKDAGPASEDPDGDFEFNYDPRATKWTPMNSNLQMQGIRVMEHAPVPEETLQLKGDSTQDTLLLLELLKHQKQNEAKGRKEERIRELAMEQKRKKEQKSQIKLSWL